METHHKSKLVFSCVPQTRKVFRHPTQAFCTKPFQRLFLGLIITDHLRPIKINIKKSWILQKKLSIPLNYLWIFSRVDSFKFFSFSTTTKFSLNFLDSWEVDTRRKEGSSCKFFWREFFSTTFWQLYFNP